MPLSQPSAYAKGTLERLAWLSRIPRCRFHIQFVLQVGSTSLSIPHIHLWTSNVFIWPDRLCQMAYSIWHTLINSENTMLNCESRLSTHTPQQMQVLCGHCTSAVSSPLIVMQTSRSLCLNPNPFLEEPNKLNLVPVRDIWKVTTNLSTFNFLTKATLLWIKNTVINCSIITS